jgi:DNA-binding GntR family transcriptional regulator
MRAPSRPADKAYAQLRELIVRGRFEPGAHLKEEELAARFAVSRSPIRDALRRLAGEGLVRVERDRGTYVKAFGPEEIDEIFQLRAALEGYGASRAVRGIDATALARLETLAGDMERLERSRGTPDLDRFTALNNDFHRTILAAARSARLQEMVLPLIEMPVLMLKHHNWRGKVNVRLSNLQHREIIAALAARDPIWARTRMHAHIISTRPRQPAAAPAPEDAPLDVL